MHWYKRDPHKALDGMFMLTLEERGAYNTILDLIYARDGRVLNDDRFLSGWCRVDVRIWRRIRDRLIECGKLYVVDGELHNPRADIEVHEALLRGASVSEVNRIKGIKSGIARRKLKELDEPNVEPNRTHPHPHPDKKERKKEAINGNEWLGEKRKPRHRQTSKQGRIWLDAGTDDFNAYAADYWDKHHAPVPLLWHESGAWFNLVGELK